MVPKSPQQTNILLHLAVWALGTPVIFVGLAAGLFALLGAPRNETLLVTILAAGAGLLIGFPLALISFFVTRGARGWRQHFDLYRAQRAAEDEQALIQEVQDNLAEHFAQTNTLPSAGDPWGGLNPYGCCADNYGPDGRLTHGAADCQHPYVLTRRDTTD